MSSGISLFQATLIIFDSGERRFYLTESRFQCSIHFISIRFQIEIYIIGAQRRAAGENVRRTVEYQTWYFDRFDSWNTLRHILAYMCIGHIISRRWPDIVFSAHIFLPLRHTSGYWTMAPTPSHGCPPIDSNLYSFRFTLLY